MTSQVTPGTDPAAVDEPARRPGASKRRRRTLTGALIGAVVLGAGGAALAANAEQEVSASALVQSYPDPVSVENPITGNADGDQAARNATYLETELVTLNGADLAGQVATAIGDPLSAVRLEAVRVGDSNVITITSTAVDEQDAVAQAQSAADVYVASRQQRLTARVASVLATVEAQIATNQQALDALPTPPVNGVDVNQQQRTALSQQNVDLLTARDTLQRAAADVGQSAGIIEQARALPTGAVSSAVLTVAGAVLLGALLGAVLAPVVSSLRGRVRDSHDVNGLGVPVLTPDLPAAGRSRRSSGLVRAVQLQGLQLPDGPVNGGSLAVVAAGAGAGTTFVAIAHARHAAARRPTLLVGYDLDELADALGGLQEPSALLLGVHPDQAGHSAPTDRAAEVLIHRATTVPGLAVLPVDRGAGIDDVVLHGLVESAAEAGWAVVVDAPPLDRSDEGVRAARQCRETVVVAAIGSSRIVDVDRAVQILHGAGATPAGIVVNHAPRRRRRRPVRHGSTRSTTVSGQPAPRAADAVQQSDDQPTTADTGRLPVVPSEQAADLPGSRA